MQLSRFLRLVFSLIFFIWQKVSSTNLYVTPFASCATSCSGNITQPYDNFLLALYFAASQSSPVINLLASNIADHFALAYENDLQSGNRLYTFSLPAKFQFTTLKIKPLFCDEAIGLTLPANTTCVQRNETITIYLKTTKITINVQSQLMVQNIIFNGIEAISDYRASAELTSNVMLYLFYRIRLCANGPLSSTLCNPSNVGGAYYCIDGQTGSCTSLDSIFKITGPTPSTQQVYQEMYFLNTNLQNFYGTGVRSFAEARSSPYFNITFENCTMDDFYFEHGLVYVYENGNTYSNSRNFWNYSQITFKNVMASRYSLYVRYYTSFWDYYGSSKMFYEGYLLNVRTIFRGTINILDSFFKQMYSVSRSYCQSLQLYSTSGFNLKWGRGASNDFQSNLDVLCTDRTNSNFVSSLVFIPVMGGTMNVINSTFTGIYGIEGGVIRVDDLKSADNSTFLFKDSTFDGNYVVSRFANILIMRKLLNDSLGGTKCPTITITNSKFINTRGCEGSYGNVGLFCAFYETNSSLQDLHNGKISPLVTVSNSVFKNNIVGLSNSLAINGSYSILLEKNLFQDNGGLSSYYLYEYSQNQAHNVVYDSLDFYSFGQATAVYLRSFYKLQSNGNTYKGNWGPFQGSQSLGISLTLLKWTNYHDTYKIEFPLQLVDDQFIDHTGVPPINSSIREKLDCYTPPIITISNTFNTYYAGNNTPEFKLINVTFANNIANYNPIYERCVYIYAIYEFPDLLTKLVTNEMRFRGGFIKFLTPSELNDYAVNIQNIEDPTYVNYGDIGLAFIGGTIRNNTIVSQGCFFPTLRLRKYFISNLTIEGNKLNPSQETYLNTTIKDQANTDNIYDSPVGVFCGFQKSSILQVHNLNIFATNLHVKNNIGPIFDLLPGESNHLYLMNSIFINNTCEYTSSILALDGSEVYGFNNIFIQNKNAYGTVFVTSSTSLYSSVFTTYVNNDGRFASLVYTNNKATLYESSSKVYNNTVTPISYLFEDNAMPQGGLYFTLLATLRIQNNTFKHNNASGGFIISSGGAVLLDTTLVTRNYLSGASLLGNFLYGSRLTLTHTNLTNNSIVANPVSQLQASLITVVSGDFNAADVRVSDLPTSNLGSILTGIQTKGKLTDIILSSVSSMSSNALISLISSNITLNNIQAENITSLFRLYQTNINISSISIQRLRPSAISLFLVNTLASSLVISGFNYTGSEDTGDYHSLFVGLSNTVALTKARFLDAVVGNHNKIFDLRENSLFFITGSIFEYTNSTDQPTIFAFESSETIRVENCVFSNTGEIVQDQNTKGNFSFIGNTILADPYTRKIIATEDNTIYLIHNSFIQSSQDPNKPWPVSQIQVIDNSGVIKMKDNIFFSMFGSKGIVQIQSLTTPYNLESTNDNFINNTGSYGGAFHLDASLSSIESGTPYAAITSSIFLLNKANTNEGTSGKGGAIYQTSPTLVAQNTTIQSCLFVNNSADVVGGAVFFDYMLPHFDNASKLIRNIANFRPNHIGSYPVKLGYFEKEPLFGAPALLNGTSPRLLSSTSEDLIRWESMPSGLTSDKTYYFALLDMFGQIFDSDNTSILEVYPNGLSQEDRYSFSNKLSIVAENGIYKLDNFKFTYKINGTIDVNFISTAIQPDRHPSLKPNNSMAIQVQFRSCSRGEYLIRDQNTVSCGECQFGFWQTSPTPDALSCQQCDSTSTICLGGNDVRTKKGYWRLNETADIVRPCPVVDACLGNENKNTSRILIENGNPSDDVCAYGQTGNLCSNCMSGWAKTEGSLCKNCDNNVIYYVRFVAVLIFQFALIIYAIGNTMTLSKEFNDSHKSSLNNAILVRVLTNYFQLISLVSDMPVSWPEVAKNFFSVVNQVSSVSQNVFSLDCVFHSDQVYGTKLVFFKLLLSTLSPFALVPLGIICIAIYFRIYKKPILRNKDFMHQVVAITVVICFMMQPSAIQAGFSVFKCDNLYRHDSPSFFLSSDYDVQCWEGDHLYWALGFGLPVLFIWCAVLPFTIFKALQLNKDKLQSTETAQKYSFLYGGYASKMYYWELVIMLRKFLLISITIAASFQSTNLQIYVSILLILFWYLLQLFTQPYAETRLNRLEELSLLSATIVNFCGLYFKIIDSIQALEIIVIICGLAGNMLFFVYFGMLYFPLQFEKLKQNEKVLKILRVVLKTLQCVKSKTISNLEVKVTKQIDYIKVQKDMEKEAKLEIIQAKEDLDEAKCIIETSQVQSPTAAKQVLAVSLPEISTPRKAIQVDGEASISAELQKIEVGSVDEVTEEDYFKESLRSLGPGEEGPIRSLHNSVRKKIAPLLSSLGRTRKYSTIDGNNNDERGSDINCTEQVT